jgi:hypothetical protein
LFIIPIDTVFFPYGCSSVSYHPKYSTVFLSFLLVFKGICVELECSQEKARFFL